MMGRSLWNIVRYAVEGGLLVASAAFAFLILLPVFQVSQTLKGNPFWFVPKWDKSRR